MHQPLQWGHGRRIGYRGAKKSRSLTFVNGRQRQVKFRIAGERIPTVKGKPVKSLGQWYAGALTDKGRGVEVMKQAQEGLKKIDDSKLPGKYKVWYVCNLACILDSAGL